MRDRKLRRRGNKSEITTEWFALLFSCYVHIRVNCTFLFQPTVEYESNVFIFLLKQYQTDDTVIQAKYTSFVFIPSSHFPVFSANA